MGIRHSSNGLLVSRLEVSATNPAQRGSARGVGGRPIAAPREGGVQAVPRVLHQAPCEVSCWWLLEAENSLQKDSPSPSMPKKMTRRSTASGGTISNSLLSAFQSLYSPWHASPPPSVREVKFDCIHAS